MGQYYKPLAMRDRGNPVLGWCDSHNYNNGLKLMEHSWLGNNFVSSVESLLILGGAWYKKPIVWAGDYAENELKTNHNLYQLCEDDNEVKPINQIDIVTYPYIVNHTKKLYVDKGKVPGGTEEGWENYKIHPLPLLTAEGNGQGGGDFRGEDPKGLIGSWARNSISVESSIPEGYTELVFDLTE